MKRLIAGAATAGLIALGGAALSQTAGTDEDIAFAGAIWQELLDRGMAGEGAIMSLPYQGGPPHGDMLETFLMQAEIDGEEGLLVVKRNYGPDVMGGDEVLADPAGLLDSVTVMFQRPEGYDPEHDDWFYAKFSPDGTLDRNPAGMALAGTVGRNLEAGCIACHVGAPGDDYLFVTDAFPRRTPME